MNTLATLIWGDLVSHLPFFKGSSDFVAATTNKIISEYLFIQYIVILVDSILDADNK